MSLCVVANWDMEDLEEAVLKLPFNELPPPLNRKVHDEQFYGPEELGFRVDVVPVKHTHVIKKEKYFGTEYKKTKLSEELIRRFEEALVTPVEGLGLLTEGHSSCGECQKSLDATSVIVDWTWHRKCLRCNRCDQPLKGHRYRMLNNQILRYQVETKQPHNRRIPR
ncbi:hypothetical protein QR680_008236 [Steinernema hermaphroditum]|uniref:LIM zinc-binding domain-containing protein n=1 Tax=Steinernema hermaphroditum TaxID=289476 RepID=A0AA39II29_9BILA|nr:hypothetical protein QR680_008236 [Steinernema hermaphroditum]